MADIGYIALILALVVSIYSAIAYIFGTRIGYPQLVASARNGSIAVFGLISLASAALFYLLVTHDFQVEYVWEQTSKDMSLIYTLSAFWAGNQGSMLFWAWMISLFTAIMVIQKRKSNSELVPYASSAALIVGAFFLIVLVFVSVANPFHKLDTTPSSGSGINPLLENVGMILHPPTLFIGYAAFTIPFAFAIAAMVTGKLDNEWVKGIRRWALIAWLFLGIGNILGMWWAYVELGWGGYWAWDPVENSSLMPWLIGTAFVHSTVMQRRKGMLKIWSMVLIILAFNLCIFGTYLTRSGILSSVHAFPSSILGDLFLGFLLTSLVISLGLMIYRWEQLKSDKDMEALVSRESSFLLNNVLMFVATLTILVFTMWPWISRQFGTETTPTTDYYNKVVGPILLVLILLMGVCVFLSWRRTSTRGLIRSYLAPLVLSLILCPILFLVGIREWYALSLFPLCTFVVCTHILGWYRELRARHRSRKENIPVAFVRLFWGNRSRFGGIIVHLGIILIAFGIIGSTFYQSETEVLLQPGDSANVGGYTLTFDEMSSKETTRKIEYAATFSIYKGEDKVGEVTSERFFTNTLLAYTNRVTDVGIRSTLLDDVYVGLSTTPLDNLIYTMGNHDPSMLQGFQVHALYEAAEDPEYEVSNAVWLNILVNPLVKWIWIGGWVLLLGGVIAIWPDRKNKTETGQNTL